MIVTREGTAPQPLRLLQPQPCAADGDWPHPIPRHSPITFAHSWPFLMRVQTSVMAGIILHFPY